MKPPDVTGLEALNELPRTGIWEVWRVRQTSLNRLVTLKILRAPIASGLADDAAFMSAAARVAGITHSNIVQIYDFRKEGSEYRLVTEYVPGQNLRDWIDKSRMLPIATAIDVAGSIAKVMKFAWEKLGIVHGALKPQNVLLDPDGVVKVSDLGLSHHFHGIASVRAALPQGIFAVTPNYMSPEQCRMDGILDSRTDIYSLGAMLYEMLTGSIPFGSMPPEEVMRRQVEGHIPNPKELNSNIPIELSFLVEKLMTKDRDSRARDWNEVCLDIERVKAGDLPSPELPQPGASTVAYEVKARPQSVQTVVQVDTPKPRFSSKFSPFSGGGPQSWMKRPMILGAIVAALVLLALAMTLNFARSNRGAAEKPKPTPTPPAEVKKKQPAKQRPPQRAVPVKASPEEPLIEEIADPTAQDMQRAAERRAAQLLAEAKKWTEENPDYYDESIGRFEKAVNAAPAGPAAQESRDCIEQLRQKRATGVYGVMAQLKARAADLTAQQKYQEALRLYETYNGPFAAESDADREEHAKGIRRIIAERKAKEQHAEYMARRVKAEAESKFNAAISNAAVCLLKGAAGDAIRIVDAAYGEIAAGPGKDQAKALRDTLADYSRLEQRVMESFLEQKDKEITVMMLTNSEKLVVIDVKGNVLHAEKQIVLGEGKISRPRDIRFADLAPSEKRQRLPAEESSAKTLALGVMMLQSGDAAAAREHLAKCGPILGPALIAALAQSQAQQAEILSRQALTRILKAARAPMPDAALGNQPCLETLRRNVYSVREAADFKTAAEEFRRRYSQTRFIKEIEPILGALEILQTDQPPAPQQPAPAPMQSTPDVGVSEASRQDRHVAPSPNAPVLDVDKLKNRLLERNPGIDEWQIKISADSQGMPESIEINATQLRDISPMAGQTGLRRVLCRGGDPEKRYSDQVAAPLSDLGPLTNLPLVELDVFATSVKDISVVRGMMLEKLNISQTQVRDITPLKGLKLVSFSCSGSLVNDLSCLAGQPLQNLQANYTDVRDLLPLKGAQLVRLELRRTKVRDISPLAGMPLQEIDLSDSSIKNLDDLKGMPLESLMIEQTEVKDLSPLAGMPLRVLYATRTGIKDIRALDGMPLEHLRLAYLEIKDITPLSFAQLRSLDISFTKVRDLSPIKGMTNLRHLFIKGTDVKSLEPIRSLPIEILFVDNPELHRKVLQDMPALKRLNVW